MLMFGWLSEVSRVLQYRRRPIQRRLRQLQNASSARLRTVSQQTEALEPRLLLSASDGMYTAVDTSVAVPVSDLLANDAGDKTTLQISENPIHGTLDLTNNVVTYSPENGYSGVDRFCYQSNDSSEIVPVTVTVGDAGGQDHTSATELALVPDNAISVSGQIGDGSVSPDADAFAISLDVGDQVALGVFGTKSNGFYSGQQLDPKIDIRDGNGNLLIAVDDSRDENGEMSPNPLVKFQAPGTGTYYVRVQASGAGGGDDAGGGFSNPGGAQSYRMDLSHVTGTLPQVEQEKFTLDGEDSTSGFTNSILAGSVTGRKADVPTIVQIDVNADGKPDVETSGSPTVRSHSRWPHWICGSAPPS